MEAYAKLGVVEGRVVVVASDLGRLFNYEVQDKNEVLEAHYRALRDLLGPDGTLVVRTGSSNLCNTDTPFGIDTTPSYRMGPFSEYVRKKEGALRSFHPFVSYAAIGPHAQEITEDVSRYAYGPDSAKARMINLDAMCISVGRHPRLTCSAVHHAEQLMAVPYRYVKEFMHPVLRNGEVGVEPFYLYVWYWELAKEIAEQQRNRNVKIFPDFLDEYGMKEAKLGRGSVYSYSLVEFFNSAMKSIKKDPYAWLPRPPESRPYRR